MEVKKIKTFKYLKYTFNKIANEKIYVKKLVRNANIVLEKE